MHLKDDIPVIKVELKRLNESNGGFGGVVHHQKFCKEIVEAGLLLYTRHEMHLKERIVVIGGMASLSVLPQPPG